MAGKTIKPTSGSDVRPVDAPDVPTSSANDIAAFVAKARAMSPHRAGARGRLVFALDATMSRQPTWDMACTLQADMFREAAALGSLDRIARIVRLTGFVNAAPGFADHPSVINGASDLVVEILGDAGRHTRAAVGVSSLPLNAAVEIDAIIEIKT